MRMIKLMNDGRVLQELKKQLYPTELYDKLDTLTSKLESITTQLTAKDDTIRTLETTVHHLERQLDAHEQYCRRSSIPDVGRHRIIAITDDIDRNINIAHRAGSLSLLLQVLVTLRYYASGSFQDVCGELIEIYQSTVSQTVTRVTDAFLRQVLMLICRTSARQTGRRRSSMR